MPLEWNGEGCRGEEGRAVATQDSSGAEEGFLAGTACHARLRKAALLEMPLSAPPLKVQRSCPP